MRRLSRSSQDRIADIGAFVDEVLYGIRTVQAFCHEHIDQRRYGAQVEAAGVAAAAGAQAPQANALSGGTNRSPSGAGGQKA